MRSQRTVSIAVTVALHAAAVGTLLQFDALRKPLAQIVPLMVDLITPVPPPPPAPKIEPPKPQPVARAPKPIPTVPVAEPPPMLATETSAPGPAWTVPAKPAPAAVVAAPAKAPAVAPAPSPIVPPAFDAAYLRNPPPAYPALSKRRGEQGRVLLRVFVSAEGAAERVEIRSSSGHARLDRAAHDAVHLWRFVPARQGERPVAAWVLVPITFSLEG